MRTLLVSLTALVTSVILLVAGNAFLTTILGTRLVLDGYAPESAGPILVLYSFGFVAGTLRAQGLIRRVGHVRAFAAFAALACAAASLYPLVVHPVVWAILRAATGFAMAGLMIVIESWLSARVTATIRGTIFGIYMVVFYLSTAAAQLFVGIADPQSFAPFNIASIVVVLSLVPLAVTRYAPTIDAEPPARLPFRQLFRTTPVGFLSVFLTGMVFGSFYFLAPAYTTAIGLSVRSMSTFMATAVLSGMVFAWPIGRLSDKLDRREVLTAMAGVSGLSALGIVALGDASLGSLYVLAALFLGPAATIYPLSMAITADRVREDEVVPASSGLLLANGSGACVGPLAASGLMWLLGPSGLFVFAAAALILLFGLAQAVIRRRPPIPVEAQGTFVSVSPETSPVIAELHPQAVVDDEAAPERPADVP